MKKISALAVITAAAAATSLTLFCNCSDSGQPGTGSYVLHGVISVQEIEAMRQSELNKKLVESARDGNLPLVKKLLKLGADINFFHETEPTYMTPLMAAVSAGRVEMVKYLVRAGADLNASAYSSPLAEAIAARRLDLVKYLVEHGADVNLAIEVDVGWNMLMTASYHGDYLIAEYLIGKGARVNDISGNGNDAALSVALSSKNYQIARMLIRKGADVNFSGKSGRNMLLDAISSGDIAAAKLLVSSGARTDIKDDSGRTLIECAKLYGNSEMIKYVEKLMLKQQNSRAPEQVNQQ